MGWPAGIKAIVAIVFPLGGLGVLLDLDDGHSQYGHSFFLFSFFTVVSPSLWGHSMSTLFFRTRIQFSSCLIPAIRQDL